MAACLSCGLNLFYRQGLCMFWSSFLGKHLNDSIFVQQYPPIYFRPQVKIQIVMEFLYGGTIRVSTLCKWGELNSIKLPDELKHIDPYCFLTVVLVNENIGEPYSGLCVWFDAMAGRTKKESGDDIFEWTMRLHRASFWRR